MYDSRATGDGHWTRCRGFGGIGTALLNIISLVNKHSILEYSLPEIRAWRFLDLRLVPLIDAVLLWGTAYASWLEIIGAIVLQVVLLW